MIKARSQVSVNIVFFLALAIIGLQGAWLRLSQFTTQVLIDDEWHAVHQVLAKTPSQLFLTLGHADFSIPLALLYWLEAEVFGLSETAMRWPMMGAGLVTLIAMPIYCRQYFGKQSAIVFSLLLAYSPLLVIYSQTARPYALTLLLSLVALASFDRYIRATQIRWKPAFIYGTFAILCCWLHLISAPLVIAPFLVTGIPALISRDWLRIYRLVLVGIPTAVGIFSLILPPLLNHPQALDAKLGKQLPDLDTFSGVLFCWLGTSSTLVVLTALLLAAAGFSRLWRNLPILLSMLTGMGLTFIIIMATQPAWVHHPLTLGRYLLPIIPLLLLAISLGLVRVLTAISSAWGKPGKFINVVAIILALWHFSEYTPLTKLIAYPNSNSLHSVYQFDFRDSANLIVHYQQNIPISPFWHSLASLPPASIKIAAAPFYFESYNWDAARWEQRARQRVLPAYLVGFCTLKRWGEVPANDRFQFRNIAYVGDRQDLIERGFDLVAFQKPYFITIDGKRAQLGQETAGCEAAIRKIYPPPIFEDELLVVFPVTEQSRTRLNLDSLVDRP